MPTKQSSGKQLNIQLLHPLMYRQKSAHSRTLFLLLIINDSSIAGVISLLQSLPLKFVEIKVDMTTTDDATEVMVEK